MKIFQKQVNMVRKSQSRKKETGKETDGNMVKGNATRIRWAEYFHELLNVVNDR